MGGSYVDTVIPGIKTSNFYVKMRGILIVLLFAVACVRCDDWISLRVGTWNIMQQPWLTNWTNDVLESFADVDLDVLVLQEVWTDKIRDMILTNKAVSKQFSFFYSSAPRQEKVGCDFTDSVLLGSAKLFVGCLVGTGVNLTQLIQPYDGPINPLCNLAGIQVALHNGDSSNFQCLSCIINSLQNSVDPFSTCAVGAGDAYSYKGANGILIMSKFKIRNVVESRFNSWLANRVNIHATIKGINFSVGHFAYNVLAEVNPLYAPYMFGDTQPTQAVDMLRKESDVLIGDFNSGIGNNTVLEYQPEAYLLLVGGGYTSTFTNVTATYCSNSSFKMCKDFYGNPYPPQAIDHVLVKKCVRIRFSEAETFNTYPLMSDHIGVRTVVSKLTSDTD